MLSADAVINVQFYDLDPMDVVWHGNYTRFLEQARCALLDRIGYNYVQMRDSGFAWPIVDLRIKYVRSIRMTDTIVVTATLVEYENRLKIDYRIRRQSDGEVLTKAHTTQVAVAMATGALQLESPPMLIEKMRALSCGDV
jgi:acyl-CoA thioester hydrolase